MHTHLHLLGGIPQKKICEKSENMWKVIIIYIWYESLKILFDVIVIKKPQPSVCTHICISWEVYKKKTSAKSLKLCRKRQGNISIMKVQKHWSTSLWLRQQFKVDATIPVTKVALSSFPNQAGACLLVLCTCGALGRGLPEVGCTNSCQLWRIRPPLATSAPCHGSSCRRLR